MMSNTPISLEMIQGSISQALALSQAERCEEMKECKERQAAMPMDFSLRLLEEVVRSKSILRFTSNRGEARQLKRSEWQRITELLNSEFGTSYTVMQVYKKVKNVKGKVKQKLDALRSSGDDFESAMGSFTVVEQYFLSKMDDSVDLSSQFDDSVFTVADADEDETPLNLYSGLSTSSALDSLIYPPLVKNDQEDECYRSSPNLNSIPTSPEGSVNASESRPVVSIGVSNIRPLYGNPQTERSSQGGAKVDTTVGPPSKKARASSKESHISFASPSVATVPDSLTGTATQDTMVEEFRANLLDRLLKVPLEQMQEIHSRVRREVDAAYAQQITEQIVACFDEKSRQNVMKRVLDAVDS